MQVPIPPDTRRDFDWIAGLTGMGMLVAGAGLTVALGVWGEKLWPVAVRAPLAIVILLITAALAWLKWPMEDHGTRLTTWAGRIWTYYTVYRTPIKSLTGHPRSSFGRPQVGGGVIHVSTKKSR